MPSPERRVNKTLTIVMAKAKAAVLEVFGNSPEPRELSVENLLMLSGNRVFDCSKAEGAFGFTPTVEFNEISVSTYLPRKRNLIETNPIFSKILTKKGKF